MRLAGMKTPNDLFKAVGGSKSAPGHWLGNKLAPSMANLERIAKELGVNIHWLVTGSGTMAPPESPALLDSEYWRLRSEIEELYKRSIEPLTGQKTTEGEPPVVTRMAPKGVKSVPTREPREASTEDRSGPESP